jgi:hypothetical protein
MIGTKKRGTGGSVIGEKVAVNSGVLNSDLLIERYEPEVAEIWARRRHRDGIDAVIAHEVAEAQTQPGHLPPQVLRAIPGDVGLGLTGLKRPFTRIPVP